MSLGGGGSEAVDVQWHGCVGAHPVKVAVAGYLEGGNPSAMES